jgi:hypothetical protein
MVFGRTWEEASTVGSKAPVPNGDWLLVLRRYMLFVAVTNLVWEFVHLPLYTIWETGTPFELAIAALHCTAGEILIALSSVMLALFLVGHRTWPLRGNGRVAALAIAFGLSYTVFSEWLNIEVRAAWAYRDLMPVVPVINTGLSPILQWIVVPLIGLRWARLATVSTYRHEVDR